MVEAMDPGLVVPRDAGIRGDQGHPTMKTEVAQNLFLSLAASFVLLLMLEGAVRLIVSPSEYCYGVLLGH
jgi:hypothetical protein